MRFSATWGSRGVLDTTLVHPGLVAEVSAVRAIDHGKVFRHTLRFRHLRLDVPSADVPRLPVRSTATNRPRDLSIATEIGDSSVSPYSASRSSRIL
ncbi:hypothetical protein [Streptomyces sp. NPDC059979]|uniref:hypothetical protein n=1 Tax=Streptomyces sp. NPDC059979 TaxID=3347021 RepID=UPI00369283B3